MSIRKNQNFRRKNRNGSLFEDEEKGEQDLVQTQQQTKIPPPIPVSDNGKNRPRMLSDKEDRGGPMVLSFNDDEEDESTSSSKIVLRKSKLSRKFAKKEKKTLRSLVNPDAPQANENDKRTPNWSSVSADEYTQEKISKQLKKEKEFTIRMIPTVLETPDHSMPTIVGGEVSAIPVQKPTELEERQPTPSSVTVIPSQRDIEIIKNQRKYRSRIGVDFIPFNNDDDGSRFIREDDEDEDDDQYLGYGDNARIKFGDPGRETSLYTAMDEEEDDAEVNKKWEEYQLSKSGYRVQSHGSTDMRMESDHEPFIPRQPSQIDPITYQPPSLDQITKQIRTTLGHMKSVNTDHQMHLNKILTDLDESQAKLQKLKEESVVLKKESEYFTHFRGYVTELLDCLHEKLSEVHELEDKLQSVAIKTADTIRTKRRKFVDDELEEIRAIMGEQTLPPASVEKQDRIKERKGIRRRKQEDRKRNNILEPEGWSSDDELTNFDDYKKIRESTVSSASQLFLGVNEEYSSLPFIIQKFEDWKYKYPLVYTQAYGSLSMSKICESFIRQELLIKWDLFNLEELNFSEMDWYNLLIDYGSRNSTGKNEDEELLPNLIANIIMDKVKAIFTYFWDPLSRPHTTRGTKLVKTLKIFEEVPAISQKMKEVLVAIHVTLQGAADSAVVLFPPKSKNTGLVKEFCERQFWSAIKLFSINASWFGILPKETLETIWFHTLLNPKLLPYLRNMDNDRDIIEACTRILSVLPAQYIVNNGEGIPLALSVFSDFVHNHIKQIQLKHDRGVSPTSKEETRDLFTKASKLLLLLNDEKAATKLKEK